MQQMLVRVRLQTTVAQCILSTAGDGAGCCRHFVFVFSTSSGLALPASLKQNLRRLGLQDPEEQDRSVCIACCTGHVQSAWLECAVDPKLRFQPRDVMDCHRFLIRRRTAP